MTGRPRLFITTNNMNSIVRFGTILKSTGILRVRCLSSEYLDPLYPHRQATINKEWAVLARKQLKGKDPTVDLKWRTAEVSQSD